MEGYSRDWDPSAEKQSQRSHPPLGADDEVHFRHCRAAVALHKISTRNTLGLGATNFP
jgi:hypothetical protein